MRYKLARSGCCFRLRRKFLYEAVLSLRFIVDSNKLFLMAYGLQMNVMKTLLLHTILTGMLCVTLRNCLKHSRRKYNVKSRPRKTTVDVLNIQGLLQIFVFVKRRQHYV